MGARIRGTQKKAAEERVKREAEEKAMKKYASENFWSLKLRLSIAPFTVIFATYVMFLSNVSIINKWEVMPWWGCILYIIGIPIGMIIATTVGVLIAGKGKYSFCDVAFEASFMFLPMVWMGYFAYQAAVNDKSVWWIILCIAVFLYFACLWVIDLGHVQVCILDSDGNVDKIETRKALLLELILIVGISLLVFILC